MEYSKHSKLNFSEDREITATELNSLVASFNLLVDALNDAKDEIDALNAEIEKLQTQLNEKGKGYFDIVSEIDNEPHSLSEAISLIPENKKSLGLKIRFLGIGGSYNEYSYAGSDLEKENWEKTVNWDSTDSDVIDGGEW